MCDLLSTLPSNSLHELYAGNKCGKILILSFKRVGPKIFRMKVRDLLHWDNFICQEEQFMLGLIPGDFVEIEKVLCIKIPQLKRTYVLLGPTNLIARAKDTDWTNLPDASPLFSQFTALNYNTSKLSNNVSHSIPFSQLLASHAVISLRAPNDVRCINQLLSHA